MPFLSFQQTQIPDYAELIVKFLEALVDSYLPAAEEERGEEQLRTPTSPYPPTSQSQLSITANLNLSNSMTSLATSQHSPGRRRGLLGNAPFCAVAAFRFRLFFVVFFRLSTRCRQRERPAVPQLCAVQRGAHSSRLGQPGSEAAQHRELQASEHQEDRLIGPTTASSTPPPPQPARSHAARHFLLV